MSAYPLSAILLGAVLLLGGPPDALPPDSVERKLVDGFESDDVGTPPSQWRYVSKNKEVLSIASVLEKGERFFVAAENENQFVRAVTRDEALRFTVRNGHEIDWNVQSHPRIQWRWRAHHLPEGASEKGKNDVGAALYVTFGTDWLGRPKSIKYTYSSALPVGTVVSFGPLKVIVVDSLREPRTGAWKTVQRDVRADYHQVFGGEPPARPLSITLWSDSDTTDDWSKVDFDDIELLPPHQRPN
jgi:hypothetical protein